MTKKPTQLLVEIAARAEIESPIESGLNGVDFHKYRFDLRHVTGDYLVVSVPMAFSTEASARATLLTELVAMFAE